MYKYTLKSILTIEENVNVLSCAFVTLLKGGYHISGNVKERRMYMRISYRSIIDHLCARCTPSNVGRGGVPHVQNAAGVNMCLGARSRM